MQEPTNENAKVKLFSQIYLKLLIFSSSTHGCNALEEIVPENAGIYTLKLKICAGNIIFYNP